MLLQLDDFHPGDSFANYYARRAVKEKRLRVAEEHKAEEEKRLRIAEEHKAKLTIKSVVDNGTMVKKGDLIVEIDDAYLQEQAQVKQIDVLKAKVELSTAEQTLPANKAAVNLARLQLKNAVLEVKRNLEKAQLDLKEFDESQKEASRQDAKNKVADTEADVELWRESVGHAARPGRTGSRVGLSRWPEGRD